MILIPSDAEALADQWIIFGDFLLFPLDEQFDVVIGNPPYVRQELIADALMSEYRARYRTIYDRADIYIPFIERSLSHLTPKGKLAFICADRWMKNRYGGPLRQLIADAFHLHVYVDMVDTPAFHSDVIAYPPLPSWAVRRQLLPRIAHRPAIDAKGLRTLAKHLLAPTLPVAAEGVKELRGVAQGNAPWILESSDQLALVRRLERSFPTRSRRHILRCAVARSGHSNSKVKEQMNGPFDLTGRVALVTGGNGGIGLGMAKGLAAAGAMVAIAGRNAAKNVTAIAELEALGARTIPIEADVTDEGSVARMTRTARDAFGRIDILVANAGMNVRKMPEDYSLTEWHEILDTNLTGVFLCAKAVLPEFKKAGGGKIITIGSMSSIFGGAIIGPYAASKGAIVQLTRSLAVAWSAHGVQVNAILPGFIDTDLTRGGRKSSPAMFAKVEERTPAGRWGQPDDLAGIAVFLASRASDYITGTAIPVDGGYSIQI